MDLKDRLRLRPLAWLLILLLAFAAAARADEPYARSRDYDLENARMHLRFDVNERKVTGEVTHTLAALRDGLTQLEFDSVDLTITAVTLRGQPAKFDTTKDKLRVQLAQPSKAGQRFIVQIRYEGRPKKGLYFVLPDKDYPSRPKQVWTQGEAEDTRYYIPIYDYPNDRTTTEMVLTVPADWVTISNGKLLSVKPGAGGMKTWDWKQSIPHSTYLISIVAGEFDEAKDTWRGIPVTYYAPRGRGERLRPTYERTPKMIEFFSQRLGVPYPWDKYAQSNVDDFVAGGMENTSATTNTSTALIHPLLTGETPDGSDDLISHELGHQWFGDLVTCKDWGHVWLNESFASYLAVLWTEHHYGADAAAYDLWLGRNQWVLQQRLFSTPIVTHNFSDFVEVAGNVYGKGSLALHMLRHLLGDADFFRALKHYLEKNRAQNVVTADLVRAIEEATGKNVDVFFDQWVYGAGIPRFEVSYTWDEAAKQVKLEVKQNQKVEGPVGLFRVPMEVEITTAAGKKTFPIQVSQASETFTFPAAERPLMVLFDPGNYILKSVTFKKDWKESLYQLKNAATVPDRADAAVALGSVRDVDEVVTALGETAVKDAFWGIRVQAVLALAKIGNAAAQKQILAALANEQPWVRQPVVQQMGSMRDDASVPEQLEKISRDDKSYRVRGAALAALARLKPPNVYDLLQAAVNTDSPDDTIRAAALRALGTLGDERATPTLVEWAAPGKRMELRTAAISGLGRLDKKNKDLTKKLMAYLEEPNRSQQFRFGAFSALIERGDPETVAPLEAWLKTVDLPIGALPFVQAQLARLRQMAGGGQRPAAGPQQQATPAAAAGATPTAGDGSQPSMAQFAQQILQALDKLQRETSAMNERLKKLEEKLAPKN